MTFSQNSADLFLEHHLSILAIKARFARVRAARGGSQAYQGSCIDPTHQSQPLDPPSEARFLILFPPSRLLDKDNLKCAIFQ